MEKPEKVLEKILQDTSLSRYIDSTIHIPLHYCGKGPIRLFILGQDPTVKDPHARKMIRMVLNLDKKKSVWNNLVKICRGLGIIMDENVYATNLFKNYFIEPPTHIKDINIFSKFLPYWLPILKDELDLYPEIPIITLGEPVMQALVKPIVTNKIRKYWGYTPEWKLGKLEPLNFIRPEENLLGRKIYPFPHQPSLRKLFYQNRMDDYIAFLKTTSFN